MDRTSDQLEVEKKTVAEGKRRRGNVNHKSPGRLFFHRRKTQRTEVQAGQKALQGTVDFTTSIKI